LTYFRSITVINGINPNYHLSHLILQPPSGGLIKFISAFWYI
jgi:hypothetical protein